ncbi:NADP-dependent oxidoreductase domain-containing protein [Radiomyces spectabilis]|uniref:NADP-dependent oxidoreductase domain-containing protein n=1 Tax=Radiomyces spectabilis TaxID=64574 RepID=UPI00221F2ED9|nr:NADP-dependent oxidoreductase domain-containing protein [Radiomyces spectabilis]KAI8384269.1 NADP-dependent oxidoreductase domain-containing protein [Radiomyces spectabilis]
MTANNVFQLNTGQTIPAIGLGTWQSKPNEVYHAVLAALESGYRHIDTAYVYRNEKQVGQAIKDSGIPRDQLFITTKLWNTSHRPELVASALEQSLDNLQLDYIDLYLMHWPIAFQPSERMVPKDENGEIALDSVDFCATYAAMEKLDKKKVRAIGVSNFSIPNLQKLLATAKIIPAVNQVELHPYLPQKELLKFCHEENIHVTAYSPLGSTDSPLIQEPIVLEVANKYNTTPAQVLISWGIQRKCSVIPKSVTPSRIKQNKETIQLELSDIQRLDQLSQSEHARRLVDPSPFWKSDIFHSKL